MQSYAHLFDSFTQDWYAVASILEDLLFKFKSTQPSISQVYSRSDEAGCYHNNSLISALPSIGERTGISVRRFDHSELQHGKDICDRILCPMKAAIRPFCNKGHDILEASDMNITLKERQVKKTNAAVCSMNQTRTLGLENHKALANFTTSLLVPESLFSTHSEESVLEANIHWALAKARSGSSQFYEKIKDYLTKGFDIGEKTGQNISAEQVAKDMRNARTHDNQHRVEWPDIITYS